MKKTIICDEVADLVRIKKIYKERDRSGKRHLYAWHRLDIRQQRAIFECVMAALLHETIGADLGNCRVLDVGCGIGSFLRMLVEWGAKPENLVGTEFLSDRLNEAQIRSPAGIRWHLGDLPEIDYNKGFDLVSAHTVFSSILNGQARTEFAKAMWDKVKNNGWIQVFDFRFNNPKNQQVRKVLRTELDAYWDADNVHYRELILAPSIARRLPAKARLFGELLHVLFPFLRTHFIYMARKPK